GPLRQEAGFAVDAIAARSAPAGPVLGPRRRASGCREASEQGYESDQGAGLEGNAPSAVSDGAGAADDRGPGDQPKKGAADMRGHGYPFRGRGPRTKRRDYK